jgi:RimJ/RimL family protein N-acetyltransferase
MMVRLEPYSEADFPLLQRNNSPEMTAHLGGPESEEKLNNRHQRYLELPKSGTVQMYVVWVDEPELAAVDVGIVGYWEKEWRGEKVWEAGWSILPEYQGHGLAGAAVAVLLDKARAEQRYRFLHAYPSVENLPSNALCRTLGFELLGEHDFEYPPGHIMRCNDWQIDLSVLSGKYLAGK